MSKKIPLAVVAAAFLLALWAGCATSDRSSGPDKAGGGSAAGGKAGVDMAGRDELEGLTVQGFSWNALDGAPAGVKVHLTALQMGDARIGRRFVLMVAYVGPDFLFLQPGETLVLVVDGERLPFRGLGSRNRREITAKDLARETACYDVTPAQLRRIAAAQDVEVLLQKTLRLRFGPGTLAGFRDFARRALPRPGKGGDGGK